MPPIIDMDKVADAQEGGSGKKCETPGKYLVEIKHVTAKEGAKGEQWGLLCEIVGDCPQKGEILFDNLFWSERAAPRTKQVLVALGAILPGVQNYKPEMLKGRKGFVEYKDSGNPAYPFSVPYDGWSADFPF